MSKGNAVDDESSEVERENEVADAILNVARVEAGNDENGPFLMAAGICRALAFHVGLLVHDMSKERQDNFRDMVWDQFIQESDATIDCANGKPNLRVVK